MSMTGVLCTVCGAQVYFYIKPIKYPRFTPHDWNYLNQEKVQRRDLGMWLFFNHMCLFFGLVSEGVLDPGQNVGNKCVASF